MVKPAWLRVPGGGIRSTDDRRCARRRAAARTGGTAARCIEPTTSPRRRRGPPVRLQSDAPPQQDRGTRQLATQESSGGADAWVTRTLPLTRRPSRMRSPAGTVCRPSSVRFPGLAVRRIRGLGDGRGRGCVLQVAVAGNVGIFGLAFAVVPGAGGGHRGPFIARPNRSTLAGSFPTLDAPLAGDRPISISQGNTVP